MYSLPGPIILRAKKERVLLVPSDVMKGGEILQRLEMTLPDELVEQCSLDGVRLFTEAGQWYAEPLQWKKLA